MGGPKCRYSSNRSFVPPFDPQGVGDSFEYMDSYVALYVFSVNLVPQLRTFAPTVVFIHTYVNVYSNPSYILIGDRLCQL